MNHVQHPDGRVEELEEWAARWAREREGYMQQIDRLVGVLRKVESAIWYEPIQGGEINALVHEALAPYWKRTP